MKFELVFLSVIFICLNVSCSKKPMVNDSIIINVPQNVSNDNFELVENGIVYFACDTGPYYFNVDSLRSQCASNYFLTDSLLTAQNDWSCTYDYSASDLSNGNNFDFVIQRVGNSFSIDSLSSNAVFDTIPYVFGNDTINLNEHPFYIGFDVQYSNSRIQLFLFNEFIGGCLHDKLFWFLYE